MSQQAPRIYKFLTYIPEIPDASSEGLTFLAVRQDGRETPGSTDKVTVAEGRLYPDSIQISQLAPIIGEAEKYRFQKLVIERTGISEGTLSSILSYVFLPHTLGVEQIGHTYSRINDGFYEIKRRQGGLLAVRFNASGSITEIKETPGVEESIFRDFIPSEIRFE